MDAHPKSPTLVETLLPWAAWGIGALVVVAVAWWLISRSRKSDHLAAVAAWAKDLLVKATTPRPARPAPEPTDTKTPEKANLSPTAPPPEGDDSGTIRTRVIVSAALIPSVLSLIWVATTVADITGGPAGLAAGVFADVLIVSTVAVAWFNPEVRRLAGAGGWVAAVAAGLLLMWHHWGTEAVFFSLVPVGSKFLWHLALAARTAWEARVAARKAHEEALKAKKAEREAEAARLAAEEEARKEAELSPELSHERKAELARLEEDAEYIEAKAERELRIEDAKAKAAHERKLAEIRRLGQQQRAMDRESASVEMARQDLIRQVNASRPASFALPSGEVPSDLSSLADSPTVPGEASLMGFGAVMGSDLGASRGRPVGDRPVIEPQVRELLAYIATAGEKASVRGAAAELKVSAPTIRRWREKAEKQGLDMSALRRRTK